MKKEGGVNIKLKKKGGNEYKVKEGGRSECKVKEGGGFLLLLLGIICTLTTMLSLTSFIVKRSLLCLNIVHLKITQLL